MRRKYEICFSDILIQSPPPSHPPYTISSQQTLQMGRTAGRCPWKAIISEKGSTPRMPRYVPMSRGILVDSRRRSRSDTLCVFPSSTLSKEGRSGCFSRSWSLIMKCSFVFFPRFFLFKGVFNQSCAPPRGLQPPIPSRSRSCDAVDTVYTIPIPTSTLADEEVRTFQP